MLVDVNKPYRYITKRAAEIIEEFIQLKPPFLLFYQFFRSIVDNLSL